MQMQAIIVLVLLGLSWRFAFNIFGLNKNHAVCLIWHVDTLEPFSFLFGNAESVVCKIQHFSAVENEAVNGKE